MQRTHLVLAALSCAAAAGTATHVNAAALRDACATSPYSDLDRARAALAAADANVRRAESDLRDAVARERSVGHDLAAAQRDYAEAVRAAECLEEARRLRDAIAGVERDLAEHERTIRLASDDADSAARALRQAEADFDRRARETTDFRHVDARLRDAQARLADAEAAALEDLERSWEWRRAYDAYEDARRGVDGRSGIRSIGHFARRAQSSLEQAERRLEELRADALDRDACVRDARRELAAVEQERDRVWTHLRQGLRDDRAYCAASRDLDAARRALAEAEECREKAGHELAGLRRELDDLGPHYVNAIDLDGAARRAQHLERRHSGAVAGVQEAQRCLDLAQREASQARRDYDRALYAADRGDRGDRYRRGDSGRGRDGGRFRDRP